MKIRVRKPWIKVPPLALALVTTLVLAGTAQAGVRVSGIDTSAYPDLRVTVLTTGKAGQPRLWENDAPVTGLRAVNLGRAKTVALAVDRSRSMKGRALTDATTAARLFVGHKSKHDRIEVITFGSHAYAVTRFSESVTEADEALASLSADKAVGTALWDAVVLAARRLSTQDQPGHVILLVTDGHDVSSTATYRDAVAAAHAAKASVYPVAIAGPDFTPGPLRDLAAETGGTYHQASSSSGLASIYESIGRELSRTWELRYPTSARPGESLRLVATAPGAGRGTRTVALPALGAATAAPAEPALLPREAYRNPLAPLAVAGAVAALILLACAFWFAARQGRWVTRRLEPHLGVVQRDVKQRRRAGRRAVLGKISDSTEQAFSGVKHFRLLQRMISRADLPLRAAELLYIGIGVAVVFGLFAAVAISSAFITLLLMAFGFSTPILFVAFKASSRVKAFDNQLPDLLITMAASLKAGHSFRQGIQSVVDEGAEPAATEFRRVLTETRLGRPMDDALNEMSDRVGSKNLSFVVTAVTIQRQIGGSLAGLFAMVAETVRQRQQFARKIKGLTAMGRASAYVLIGLPFFIAFAITLMNPAYMSPLYHTSTGHELILIGLGMMTVGTLILKKMVSFRG
jgi:tight adherence protein B